MDYTGPSAEELACECRVPTQTHLFLPDAPSVPLVPPIYLFPFRLSSFALPPPPFFFSVAAHSKPKLNHKLKLADML